MLDLQRRTRQQREEKHKSIKMAQTEGRGYYLEESSMSCNDPFLRKRLFEKWESQKVAVDSVTVQGQTALSRSGSLFGGPHCGL